MSARGTVRAAFACTTRSRRDSACRPYCTLPTPPTAARLPTVAFRSDVQCRSWDLSSTQRFREGGPLLKPMSNDSSKSALSLQHRYEGAVYRRIMLGGIKHIPTWLQRLTMPMWGGIFYFPHPQSARSGVAQSGNGGWQSGFWQTHRRGLVTFRNYAQMLTDSYKGPFGAAARDGSRSIGRTPSW